MKNRQLINVFISDGGMLLLLSLAYGLDRLREYEEVYYGRTFLHFYEFQWSGVLANLLLAATILTWLWFVLVKLDANIWIRVSFICVGLLITFYPLLYFTPLGVLQLAYRFSPAFQVYLTGGIVAAAGVFKLIAQPSKKKD